MSSARRWEWGRWWNGWKGVYGDGLSAAVRVRIQDTEIVLITAHFKSKLLTFPPNRFSPHDEGERARFGAYALYRRLRRRNLRTRSHPRPQSQETFADRAWLTSGDRRRHRPREELLDALTTVAREQPALSAVLVTHHLEELPLSTSHALRADKSSRRAPSATP